MQDIDIIIENQHDMSHTPTFLFPVLPPVVIYDTKLTSGNT